MADLTDVQAASPVQLVEEATGNIAKVSADGRLKVEQAIPTAPPSTTAVFSQGQSVVTIAAPVDTVYVITNAKTLTLQSFRAGGLVDFKAGGSVKIELFYDPLGTGVGMTLLDVIYSGGQTTLNPQSFSQLGNGTRAIRMRRTSPYGAQEIYGRWDGYEA